MRRDVIVQFGPVQRFTLPADTPLPRDDARAWLDRAFVEGECEPLRASGKVLTADRVLGIADAVGLVRFAGDAAFAEAFARAAGCALDQPLVRVEVDAGAVTF